MSTNGGSVDAAIRVNRIYCHDEADGFGNAEPYLWPVYFKIDMETVLHLKESKVWFHAPGGRHGNLSVSEIDAKGTIQVPSSIGSWSTTLVPLLLPPQVKPVPPQGNPVPPQGNPVPPQGNPGALLTEAHENTVIGCIVVLLEEDDGPLSKDMPGHYETFASEVRKQLEQLVLNMIPAPVRVALGYKEPEPRPAGEKPPTGISEMVAKIEAEVLNALKEQFNPKLEELEDFANIDDVIGVKCQLSSMADLMQSSHHSFSKRMNESNGSEDGDFELFGEVDTRWVEWEGFAGGYQSAPSAAFRSDGYLHVFAGATDQSLIHIRQHGNWSRTAGIGGKFIGAPSAVSWGPKRIDVFARGTNNQLYQRYYWEEWSDWSKKGGDLRSEPVAIARKAKCLDVFARGSAGTLVHRAYDGGWKAWADQGGKFDGRPTVVSWASNRLDVFVRGLSGTLLHAWWTEGSPWSGWEDLGGKMVSDPVAVSWGFGRLDVFAIDPSGQMIHKWFQGSWSGFETLQAKKLVGGLAGISCLEGHIAVVGRQQSGDLVLVQYGPLNGVDKGGTSGWKVCGIGGDTNQDPAVASRGRGMLDVFAIDKYSNLRHYQRDSSNLMA